MLSFGFTNAPAAFMDLMNRVFRNYVDAFVIIFIYDMLVYLKNEGDHMGHFKSGFESFEITPITCQV